MATRKTTRSKKGAERAPEITESPEYAMSGRAGRFVVLSDLHAHQHAAFAKGDGAKNTRLQYSLRILRESLQYAREQVIPWVFAGDLVHTAGYTLNVVLAELTAVLADFPDVVKLAVWGNHDVRGIGGKVTLGETVFATLKRIPNLVMLDADAEDPGPHTAYTNGLTFSGAGYQPRPELLKLAPVSDVGVYHQTIQGSKTPQGVALTEGVPIEQLLQRHRVVIIGHVHHWQYIHPRGLKEKLALIPGSPEHHNFGDAGDRGWWVITVPPKGEPTADLQLGGSPEFRTVETPRDVKSDGHYYRVRTVPAGTQLPDGVNAIAPAPTSIQSRDVLQGARGEQVLEAWVKHEPPVGGPDRAEYLRVGRSLLQADDDGALTGYRLRSVTLRNFCSYEEQTFTIRDGTWLVLGRGRDFPSNGAGKSTLFEAIFWALFGRTTKGLTGDEVIRWGADACEVSLDLWIPEEDTPPEVFDSMRVTRSRGGKNAGLRVETSAGPMEAKSVTELTEKLCKRLGLTEALYQALGYFSQERLLLFASATDGERKEMLADLIGLSAYQDASATAAQQALAGERARSKVETVRGTATARLHDEQSRLGLVQAKQRDWKQEHERRSVVARTALDNFMKVREERRGIDVARLVQKFSEGVAVRSQRLAVRQAEAEAFLQMHPTVRVVSAEELQAAQTTHKEALAEVLRVRAALTEHERAAARVVKRRDDTARALTQGTCLSCGQVIAAEHRARCMAPIEAEQAELRTEFQALTAQQQSVNPRAIATQEALRVLEQAQATAGKVAEVTSVREGILREMQELHEEHAHHLRMAEEQVEKSLTAEQQQWAAALELVAKERNPHVDEERGVQDRIKAAEAEIERLAVEQAQIEQQIAVAEYWARGFSKQGIQSLLVDEVAVLFNAVRGMIFPALTQGVYDVQFSTVSQTKSGEWRERTEFQVFEHGVPVPYAALSGGQRRRVDVGVMLTLVKAVSSWMRVPGILGVLVLDEVFGFLDASGAEGLMEALRELQEQIPTIYVVSHEAALQALFPESVVVEQDAAGVSRLTLEIARA